MRVFLASPSDGQPRCPSEIARRQALPITNENGRSATFRRPKLAHFSVPLDNADRGRGVPTISFEEIKRRYA